MQIPNEFKKACRNLGPNITDVATSVDELVQVALIGVDRNDAKVIKGFLDDVLEGSLDHDDLKAIWWATPATLVFRDGQEVELILRKMRDAVMRPPYIE